MLRKSATAMVLVSLLSACDNLHPNNRPDETPVEVAQQKEVGTTKSPRLPVDTQPLPPLSIAEQGRREGDLVRYYAHPGAKYLIRTAPLRATALQLRPDDREVRVFGGDTERWQIDLVEAGGRVTIIIKPTEWKLWSNIQVATSEGLYSFDLATAKNPDDIVVLETYRGGQK